MFNVPGFTQRFLGGSINNAGSVTMDLDATVTLGGFNTSGHLALCNGGLTASGTFALSFGNVSGNFFASLTVANNGTYSGGVFASLTIDGYLTESLQMICDNTGLRGGGRLNFGSLQVPMNLVLTPSSISGSGSASSDTGWDKKVEANLPPNFGDFGDLWGRLIGSVSLNLSLSGTVTATHTLTLHWWWGRFNSDPPQLPGQTASVASGTSIGRNGRIAFTFGVTCPCGTFFDSWSFDLRNPSA